MNARNTFARYRRQMLRRTLAPCRLQDEATVRSAACTARATPPREGRASRGVRGRGGVDQISLDGKHFRFYHAQQAHGGYHFITGSLSVGHSLSPASHKHTWQYRSAWRHRGCPRCREAPARRVIAGARISA